MAQPNSSGNFRGAGRDPRLSSFAFGGHMDGARPDGQMATTLEAVTGASGRPPTEASDDEVVGMMGCWQALEAHAHARLLAAVREIIRRRAAEDKFPTACRGDLPRRWDIGVAHEVAAELRISWQAAAPLVQLAWELEARLPRVGALLEAGVLTSLKVKIITDELTVLDDEKIAEAEKRLLEEDLAADDMTPGRLRKLCQKIVDTVDPDGARERRENAQRDRARVSFYRAHGGDTAMFAEGLPPDEALKCQANIQARALDYKQAMIYPEAGMDLLRVLAMVDLINGLTLDGRIARYHAEHAAAEDARNAAQRARDQETAESLARYRSDPPVPRTGENGNGGSGAPEYGWPDDEDDPETARYGDDPDKPAPPIPDEEPGDLGDDCCLWPGFGPGFRDTPDPGRTSGPDTGPATTAGGDGDSDPAADGSEDDGEDGRDARDPGDDGPGESGGGGNGPGRDGPSGNGPGGNRPGGTPNGSPDPGLPALTHLTLPLATLLHLAENPGEAPGYGSIDPALVRDLAKAAAGSPRTQYCLTITDEHGYAAAHACARLIRDAGPGARDGPAPGGWNLAPDHARTGPDGGYGAWILTVPAGRRYRLDLYPVPTHRCDHRYATAAYRPGTLLRHLVEVRDGECTFTGCSHPASRCDFEHARPYDQGGATDACNAGARSRRCHQVKQSRGWAVTQPKPGWHGWRTPSGRTYTKGPKRYLLASEALASP